MCFKFSRRESFVTDSDLLAPHRTLTLGHMTPHLMVEEVPVINRNALGASLLIKYNVYSKDFGANISHLMQKSVHFWKNSSALTLCLVETEGFSTELQRTT